MESRPLIGYVLGKEKVNMPFIEPEHIPDTGNQEIDRDHRLLADAMNDIYAKWQNGLLCPELAESLRGLRALLSSHFAKEITIARGAGYQRWLAHHQEHKAFISRFDAFLKECLDAELGGGARIDVFMELERHLFEHEVMADQDLWGLWQHGDAYASSTALIDWRPAFSVGIEQIDHQHQRLIELLNEIYLGLRTGQVPLSAACERLKAIHKEAFQHFQAEEKYFSHLPPDVADHHRLSHEGLIKELKRAVDDSEGADAERLTALLEGYLKFWLVDHIVNTDSRLREYLR